jgi:hypothetical protein
MREDKETQSGVCHMEIWHHGFDEAWDCESFDGTLDACIARALHLSVYAAFQVCDVNINGKKLRMVHGSFYTTSGEKIDPLAYWRQIV